MNRLTSRQTSRYESMNPPEESENVTSRSLYFSPITQAPVIGEMPSIDDWEHLIPHGSLNVSVSEPMWHAVQSGAPIQELIQASPKDVITVLRDHSIAKVGTFEITDATALMAFGQQPMLTRGSDTAKDPRFAENWKQIIDTEVEKYQHKHLMRGSWEMNVKIAAYVVTIKDAAGGRGEGLLSPLVQKSQTGATSNVLWDFPAVRAVIEYKWRHWARRYYVVEFILYLGWLISYVVFLATYIEYDLEKDFGDQRGDDRFFQMVAWFFDVWSVIFMLPFIVVEYNTICFYGLRWFQMWNLFDSLAYFLQIVITFGHLVLRDYRFFGSGAYHTILAIQCVLLFIKVQYFARLFGSGSSFIELLARVIYKVRAFFLFIILTMVSVAMAFAVLYKDDVEAEQAAARESNAMSPSPSFPAMENQEAAVEEEEEEKDADSDFGNIVRSLVTTYAVLLGDFDSSYVFDTTNGVVKGIFFLSFQVLMSITVLNLLIAVMTESYVTVVTDQRIMFNMNRAQAMDELELSLPLRFGPRLKPYCHFIVVQNEETIPPTLSAEESELAPIAKAQAQMKNEITEMKQSLEELKAVVGALAQKLD